MPSCTSPPVSATTLPISRVIASAMSAFLAVSRSPTRRSTSPRTGAGVRDQVRNPSRAERTAASTSSAPESGKQPIRSVVSAGLRFSKYRPVLGATHLPAMKLRKFVAMVFRGGEPDDLHPDGR
jgi:hypothetical protein